MRRRLIRLGLLAVLLAVLGFFALGMPGVPILYTAMFLMKLVGVAELGGDQVWPAVLGISMLEPFALIPADLIAARAAKSRSVRISLAIIITLAIDVAATCVGLLLNS